MLATEITTHVNDALARLLQQYKGRPLFQGLITALVQQVQVLEDALYPMDALRQLANAYGAQLDGIGQIVGIGRNGLTDAQYLILILGKIDENTSDTTINTMLNVIQTLFSAQFVFLKELFPAAVGVNIGSGSVLASLIPLITNIIENSLGAGISLEFIVTYDLNNVFRFRSANGPQIGQGFGSATNPDIGGVFGNLIYNNAVS